MNKILFIIILLQTIKSISARRYRDRFKKICGKQNPIGRIVGGENAALGEFPFMARIGANLGTPAKPFEEFFCGGSLITDRHVLTAEHCFHDLAKDKRLHLLIVSLGDNILKNPKPCVGNVCVDHPVTYKVAQLIPYDMDEETFIDDISILKLTQTVRFTRWISPICLPNSSKFRTSIGDMMVTIGFGLINSRQQRVATRLQKVTIPIKPKKDCETFSEKIAPGQICAGSDTKDSCCGDSGGPLFKVIQTKEGPRFTQLGVVSYGSEHCEDVEPAVYEGVVPFLNWIDQHLF